MHTDYDLDKRDEIYRQVDLLIKMCMTSKSELPNKEKSDKIRELRKELFSKINTILI